MSPRPVSRRGRSPAAERRVDAHPREPIDALMLVMSHGVQLRAKARDDTSHEQCLQSDELP
ncbi:MAG: hypothetical protein K0V04_10195 [Deltaproteobacteria bacterium]|nr:hypothetical protein [Deltaproteobacteria bacterium]